MNKFVNLRIVSFVAAVAVSSTAQISITASDIAGWKDEAVYYQVTAADTMLPSFTVSVGPAMANNFSMMSGAPLDTLGVNGTHKADSPNSFQYNYKITDQTRELDPYGWEYRLRERHVNGYGSVVLPNGVSVSYIGIRYKTVYYIRSTDMTGYWCGYRMFTKEYGMVCEVASIDTFDQELFTEAKVYPSSGIFTNTGSDMQQMRLMKIPQSTGMIPRNSELGGIRLCVAPVEEIPIEKFGVFNAMGRKLVRSALPGGTDQRTSLMLVGGNGSWLVREAH